jgi:hypothetical protein
MKKSILCSLAICLIIANQVHAQGRLINKAKNSITNEILGKPDNGASKAKQEPEPACANDQAELIMDMGGKLQLDYKELTISILNDGRILAMANGTKDYYIVKDGVTQGPYKSGDPKIAEFETTDEDNKNVESFLLKNKPYISRSGEKFIITFNGKKYGPFAQINNFTVTKSKDKFAAMVIENIIVNEDQGKKMEEAIKNAKTDQEKMDLAMKYTQEMQQKMMQGGGPMSTMPKLVTNIPNITYDPLKSTGGTLNGNIKYDDILMSTYDKIIDLQGKVLLTLKPEASGAKDLFVNSANTKYAYYNYGTLTFSDNTSLSDLFNPHLVKVNGNIYLAYMYYSPKKNSIMQWKIPF